MYTFKMIKEISLTIFFLVILLIIIFPLLIEVFKSSNATKFCGNV